MSKRDRQRKITKALEAVGCGVFFACAFFTFIFGAIGVRPVAAVYAVIGFVGLVVGEICEQLNEKRD